MDFIVVAVSWGCKCQNAKVALGAGVSSEGCCWLLKGCDSPLAFFILFRGLKSLKIRKQNYKFFKVICCTLCAFIYVYVHAEGLMETGKGR